MKIKINQKNRFSVLKARYRLEHELGDYSGQFEFHKICFGVRAQIRMLFQFYILVGISFGMASHMCHNYDCICITISYDDFLLIRDGLPMKNYGGMQHRPKTKARKS